MPKRNPVAKVWMALKPAAAPSSMTTPIQPLLDRRTLSSPPGTAI
jgi:hypothetical protein